jgi:hypothetical protein
MYRERGYLFDIQGNALNDMFAVGEGGTLQHFNGSTWQQIGPPYSRSSPLLWRRVACTPEGAAAAGYMGNRAVVIRLWR